MTLLDTLEVADLLRIQPHTLKTWRARKVGPPYVRLEGGRIRYPEDQLKQWINDRMVSA